MLAFGEDESTRGNMDEVLRALAAAATERAERIGHLNAELIDGAEAGWYVASTHPAHELVAAAHLSARRFGVYVPMLDEVTFGPKGKRRLTKRMFPGYVFVFVWGIERHVAKIHACPGVARLLMMGEERPAPIGQDFIDEAQMAEARSVALADGLYWRCKKRRKRWRNRDETADVLTSGPKCYFSNVESLDDQSRVSVLHKALGL